MAAWKWGSELLGVMNTFSILVMLIVLKVNTYTYFNQFVYLAYVLLIVCQFYLIKNGNKNRKKFYFGV